MCYKPKDKVNAINDENSVTSSIWKRRVSLSNHSTEGGGYCKCSEVRRVLV